MDINKNRFYENYEAIRKFIIADSELEKKEEILALSDVLYSTRTEKINKKGQEIEPVIQLLSQVKKIPLKVRKQAVKKGKKILERFFKHYC